MTEALGMGAMVVRPAIGRSVSWCVAHFPTPPSFRCRARAAVPTVLHRLPLTPSSSLSVSNTMSLPRLTPSSIIGVARALPLAARSSARLPARHLLSTSSRRQASVASTHPSEIASSSSSSSQHQQDGRTPLQARKAQNVKPQDRRTAIEDAKERKFRQYEKMLKAKAAQEGVSTIEELAAKRRAERDASLAATLGLKPPAPASTKTEQRDADLAARIRERAEAEAKRKLESGELNSNPNGDKSPIKPLSSILDLHKLKDEPAEKIRDLWTGYHTIKNKLSAVIPTEVYERLVRNAKQYPQFVLPLPRTIVGSESDQNIALGEQKQGYEMQFMEWGFLPPPPPPPFATVENKPVSPPTPTTVLFTPLAEYKLRQEFAQPLLVLTHYTDLARDKGIVLMRGDITSSEEVAAAPMGVVAAEQAKARGASEDEVQRLRDAPVQTQALQQGSESGGEAAGRMSEKDAQLLAMTMQRFYLPATSSSSSGSSAKSGDASALERERLLRDFHEDKEAFSVQKLCEVAFTF